MAGEAAKAAGAQVASGVAAFSAVSTTSMLSTIVVGFAIFVVIGSGTVAILSFKETKNVLKNGDCIDCNPGILLESQASYRRS